MYAPFLSINDKYNFFLLKIAIIYGNTVFEWKTNTETKTCLVVLKNIVGSTLVIPTSGKYKKSKYI